jgi:opacity protein-like surface antigen
VVGAAADFNWLARSNGDGSWMSTGGYADTVISSGAGGTTCPNGNYSVCTVSGTAAASGSVQATANWIGTLRAKVGIAGDRWLAYATGGLAYGQVRLASSATYADGNFYNYTACGGCGGPSTFTVATSTAANWSGSMTQTRTGWAIGGGINYALTNNIFVKTEGIYYDLGKSSLNVNGTGTTSCTTVGTVVGCGGGNFAGVATPVASYTVERRFNGVIASLGAGIKF